MTTVILLVYTGGSLAVRDTMMRFFTQQKKPSPSTMDNIPRGYRLAQSAEDLANQSWASAAIQEIAALVALPTHYFLPMYRQPLMKFLLLTQHCDNAVVFGHLQAVVHGLTLRRATILPKGVEPDSIREKKDRWTYAVFIALLMYDLAQRLKPLSVYTVNPDGDNVYTWSPLVNDLPVLPYAFKPLDTGVFSYSVTPLLLHRLFDECCLNWLCEELDALNDAVEAMVRPSATSSIGPLIIRSFHLDNQPGKDNDSSLNKGDALSSSEAVEDLTEYHTPDTQPLMTAPQDTDQAQTNKPSARTVGRLFLDWLITAVNEEKQSLLNPRLVHRTPQGLALLSPAIFQHYAAISGYNWKHIQKGFLKLRLHEPTADTHETLQTLTLADGSHISAIVIPSLSV